jgi:tryptophan halogenase
MVRNVLVLGAGSAGLLAAITLKRKIPELSVRVVRSPEIAVIGVGESTTPAFPRHLFDYLKLNRKMFYALANPTWKMGIHFLWGPRDSFEYTFDDAMDAQWGDLPKPNGFYCDEQFHCVNLSGALMAHGKAFSKQPDDIPKIPDWVAFHLHNPQLVSALETIAKRLEIEFVDGKTNGVVRGDAGLSAVVLEDGRKLEADLFIDASGFRSELLGRAMNEPFVSFEASLFCDRALVGSWDRTDDFIYPYTVAETMDAGWCWRIDHEHSVNRGYVYSSRFITDDQARDEFVRKNPKVKPWDHVVKYRSGRYRRGWVDNVVGLGNACGFVEPLEATALMVLCGQSKMLVDLLQHSELSPTPSIRDLYNRAFVEIWDDIRDFLSIHYKFNTRLDTPFWQTCRAEADVSGCAELLRFFGENGPTGLCRHLLRGLPGIANQFGVEGYLVMLVGNRVPYQKKHAPDPAELQRWLAHVSKCEAEGKAGVTVQEALKFVKHPNWRWFSDGSVQ